MPTVARIAREGQDSRAADGAGRNGKDDRKERCKRRAAKERCPCDNAADGGSKREPAQGVVTRRDQATDGGCHKDGQEAVDAAFERQGGHER
jgi:hypothetical protein